MDCNYYYFSSKCIVYRITNLTLMRLYADTLLCMNCSKWTPYTVDETTQETDLDNILCVITYPPELNYKQQSFRGA